MKKRSLTGTLLSASLIVAPMLGATIASCGSSHDEADARRAGPGGKDGPGEGDPAAPGGSDDLGGSSGGDFSAPEGPFTDFPKEALVEPGLPAGLTAAFQGASESASGGPCLSEPALDAMVPRNWTPLVFEWSAAPGQNVFELRLHVKNQTNDLVVYTTGSSFAVDKGMWDALTRHSAGLDVEITLRGAASRGEALLGAAAVGAKGAVHIAPASAPGAVVYWTPSGGTAFRGFTIGDAQPRTVLSPLSAGPNSTGGLTTCVSCHTSSPDGKLVIYTQGLAPMGVDVRRIDGSGRPSEAEVSSAALALLGRPTQNNPVTSPAHYSPSDAVVISVLSDLATTRGRYELVWTDLHATGRNGSGILRRDGDTRHAIFPSWRRDGTAIAYISSSFVNGGFAAEVSLGDTADIYTVPYNGRAGGDARPLPGASEPQYSEFYPVYSPDDTLLAFNRTRIPARSYDQPLAEVFVVPGDGGAAVRLRANDPPACTGLTSPGLTNSWPRWAPSAEEHNGLKYYWVVFSSRRHVARGVFGLVAPQLYMAAVVTRVNGGVETIERDYPAVLVGSQNPAESNHTPAWDVFEVEEVPDDVPR